MDDLEHRRQEYIRRSGLGEPILPPVRMGDCEVSLHRRVGADPLWALMEQDAQDDNPVKWFLLSFPDGPNDGPQGEPTEQVFSAPRGEVPEALREIWGDHPHLPPSPAIGDVVFVTVCPDGSIDEGGGGPYGVGGTIGESGAAVHGQLPAGAVSVEVTVGEEAMPVHVEQELFLAAVPRGVDVRIIFRGPRAEIVNEESMSTE